VLNRVAALLNDFVRKVSSRLGMSEPAVKATQGKIFTFGSYRLGVHGPGSDIDVICVLPKHVSRNAFFELFEVMLWNIDTVTQVSVGIITVAT
jgi:poly(A) polymerase